MFICVGNTCVIVTGFLIFATIKKELLTSTAPSVSILHIHTQIFTHMYFSVDIIVVISKTEFFKRTLNDIILSKCYVLFIFNNRYCECVENIPF